ncbi:anhydro-N-acetylmuramic acid kinase [Sulfurimonas sp.]|nr:anhydro-N-acetylmuramic acid kinase [Sulfurimonas sp.]
MGELYIGVMSGTSLDGIDIALCEIDNTNSTLIHAHEYRFNHDIKEEILTVIAGTTTLEQVGTLNSKLGTLFANSINTFIKQFEINTSTIKAIGLHGQTLWHQSQSDFPFSMQLGCPNIVHAKTGIQVIADFRSMDIANGGEGAPFAPAFHEFLFASIKKKTAVLNIGGMANITLLDNEVKGWDIGAGNVLLDLWIKKCKGVAYDRDGLFAQSGEVNTELLEKFLDDPYFKKLPPKSTGREYFNENWIANALPMFQTIADEDIQRTLLELTAQTIKQDIQKSDIDLLIVCGGGAKNIFLMQRLQSLCECEVSVSDTYGVSGDSMEAMAFAWLAYKRVNGEVVNLKSVTGARKNSILGGIYG